MSAHPNRNTLKIADRMLGQVCRMIPKRRLALKPDKPGSILVIKLSAMGDAFCMMPAVRLISESLPGASIDWLTTMRTSPFVFEALPFIRTILIMPTSWLQLIKFSLKMRFLKDYDLIIDFDQYYQVSEIISTFGKTSAGFMAPLKGATFAISCKYNDQLNEKIQFRDLSVATLNCFAIEPQPYSPELPELLVRHVTSKALKDETSRIISLSKKTLVIYPGSGGNAAFRRWPWEYFSMILREFESDLTIVIAGGADENGISTLIEQEGYKAYNWINKWSLLDWGWFLRETRPILVGNDGGFLHLAEAVGVPSIAIFGPSRFSRWGSINPLSVSIEVDVPCRPCLNNHLGSVPTECWRQTSECLTSITPERVIKEIYRELTVKTKVTKD
jgi:ADP-heptose:LPS heptosyltransferase